MTAEGLLLQRDPQPEGGAGHHLRAVHPRPARDTQEGGGHAHLLKVTHPSDENNRNYSALFGQYYYILTVKNRTLFLDFVSAICLGYHDSYCALALTTKILQNCLQNWYKGRVTLKDLGFTLHTLYLLDI